MVARGLQGGLQVLASDLNEKRPPSNSFWLQNLQLLFARSVLLGMVKFCENFVKRWLAKPPVRTAGALIR